MHCLGWCHLSIESHRPWRNCSRFLSYPLCCHLLNNMWIVLTHQGFKWPIKDSNDPSRIQMTHQGFKPLLTLLFLWWMSSHQSLTTIFWNRDLVCESLTKSYWWSFMPNMDTKQRKKYIHCHDSNYWLLHLSPKNPWQWKVTLIENDWKATHLGGIHLSTETHASGSKSNEPKKKIIPFRSNQKSSH